MRAFQVTDFDAPPALATLSSPKPGPDEVLIAVRACGLNFADLLAANGKYQERRAPPFTLGMEVAGEVIACGPEVTALRAGQRVAAFTGAGGLAEQVAVPAARALPLPEEMPFDDAAAFQVAYGTSHLALDEKARLAPGETLLVLGAAGGVGLTAVEIGKRMGARVIACARGPEKLAIAEKAGADHLIDSSDADLREAVLALGGADVVYDPVGGAAFTAAFRATRPDGRILVVGFASGDVPPIPANHMLVKNVTVIGFWWGGYLAFAPDKLTGSLATLFDWYGSGGLRPHISHRLPLSQAAEGLELLRSRQSTGKIVITP
ncbi:MAG: NADPH:quinone oxidoreductase family protein [Pseudomonadota bacterium]